MTYRFHFSVSGYVEIEADNPDEALDLFDRISDYSKYANNDAYDVAVYDEDGNYVEDFT